MIELPDDNIAIFTNSDETIPHLDDILSPMQGNKRRDWFVQHAYFCLPLVIGNQMGIGIRALYDFDVIWEGGVSKESCIVTTARENRKLQVHQNISSHFGMGTVTIQNNFHFRTPKGINLMTINPPNHFIDGVHHMTGVVESDNLPRDFTFNLKITRKDHLIEFKKGDLIGCMMPVKRYLGDGLQPILANEIYDDEEIEQIRQVGQAYGVERSEIDIHKPNGNGRRYVKGHDIHGDPFDDHQTTTVRKQKINKTQ